MDLCVYSQSLNISENQGEGVQDSGETGHGLEAVSLRKRQESELKMLTFSLGVKEGWTGLGTSTSKGQLMLEVREDRLRWFGHVQRRESEYISRRMLDMELPGRSERGRPKRRNMDGINEDMKLVGASVEDAEDRDRWREMICCGHPSREKLEEEDTLKCAFYKI
ncbi:hypothetical protein KOW79_008767 [Hemibagrus wyckioides]|uniref:Uncharacterized protein n=1 Tax=Hemibagrus wyckioides TaxID=337641 RepID=A0A9D3NPD1_9TELE|nr:hypothetical protein KOW79_008767 [Hemibagrus wyckioides]